MTKEKPQKTYSRDLQREALRLILEECREITSVAQDLGIDENVLYDWKSECLIDNNILLSSKGRLRRTGNELLRLKQEISNLKEEREILKKALVIFSDHKK